MKDRYTFTTKAELDFIHEKSMEILETVGVIFAHDDAIAIFKEHGFRTEGQTVFMTAADVEKALETAPATFEWVGRGSSVTVGGGKTICAPAYGPILVLENGEFHKTTQRDFLNFTKLHASSPVLDVSNPNMIDFNFMDASIASNWAQATTLLLDTRPAIGMVDGYKHAEDSIAMARRFYGAGDDQVMVNGLISVASPAHYSPAMCEALITYAKAGQGMFITPSSLNGMTVPGSLASLLLMNNVEVLAGIVLAQVINPGAPVIYGNQSHGCDLRYGTPSIGSPEQCLIFSAAKAFGDYYHLPVRTGGSSCDAKQVDMQAGVESYATMFATLQSGADFMVHSCGSLDSDSTISYDKYIYDEEILLYIRRILRGIEVNEDTLLVDAIKDIGPGGTFLDLEDDLMDDSTEAYDDDYIILKVPSREGHATWDSRGRRSVTDRTGKIVGERLAAYTMPDVTADQLAAFADFVPQDVLTSTIEAAKQIDW